MPYNLNIKGMMHEDELKTIEQLAKTVPPNGVIVEVGSFVGRSSVAWAMSVDRSATVYCYDIFNKNIENNDGTISSTWEEFLKNIADFNNVVPVRGITPTQTGYIDYRSIDLFFIDAGHANPNDWNIIQYFLPFVKSGGTISGHDYSSYLKGDPIAWPAVNFNVHRLEEMFNKKATISMTLWHLTKP